MGIHRVKSLWLLRICRVQALNRFGHPRGAADIQFMRWDSTGGVPVIVLAPLHRFIHLHVVDGFPYNTPRNSPTQKLRFQPIGRKLPAWYR